MINKTTSRRNLVLAGSSIQKLSLWRKIPTEGFSALLPGTVVLWACLSDPAVGKVAFCTLLNLCHHFPVNSHPALQETVVSWVKAMSGTENNSVLVRHFEISASYGGSQKLHDGSWMQPFFHCTFLVVATVLLFRWELPDHLLLHQKPEIQPQKCSY